jgi:hypothetical protein
MQVKSQGRGHGLGRPAPHAAWKLTDWKSEKEDIRF